MTKFIGDVHGKYESYLRLIKDNFGTIQVGDMGVGFRRWPHGELRSNPPYDEMVKSFAMYIRGNHDNPTVCYNHTQCIKDGHVEGDMMFIGGAYSVDWDLRYEGFNWWRDEECSPEQFLEFVDTYEKVKPRIMVTHDCPGEVVSYMPYAYKPISRTSSFFNHLWQLHQPDLWVYGHHHHPFNQVLNGTRFVCLDELEMREF